MTRSYWLDTEANITSADLTTENHFDIIIVGSGIAGLSTAFWLEQKDPKLKIVIIDQGPFGGGASGRNAGFITCGSAEHFYKLSLQFGLTQATEIWKFSEANRELLKSHIFGDDFGCVDFSPTGSCTVAATDSDWQRYHELASTMQSVGIDVSLIDETFLTEYYGVRNFSGAIQYAHDGVIHPVKLLNKIKSKLHRTKFILNSAVLSSVEETANSLVKLPGRNISSDKIIFCLNGFAGNLVPELKTLIKPQRGQIIVTEPLRKFVQGPCYLTKHLCYFRQLPSGELLVGGFRNHDLEAENSDVDQISPKIQTALTEFTESYFKDIASVKINYRWSGIMGFTPDNQMVIGRLPSHENSYAMAGCSGHGMGLSFHSAKVLVDSIYGIKIPVHLDIKRFSSEFSQTKF